MSTKIWKDIQIGDKFADGSVVTRVHDVYEENCFAISYEFAGSIYKIVLSKTHLLLISMKSLSANAKKWVEDVFIGYNIPTLYDKHIYIDKQLNFEENDVPVNADPSYVEETDSVWLPVNAINKLLDNGEEVFCGGSHILIYEDVGFLKVMCVETDTHNFEVNHLIHHNSVTLRNIIFHCLTHSHDISIALIDLKYTEFTPYKGVNGVVAVANTVKEAAEIMRIARECMYKRNQQMAELGINDIKDYKPTKPTDDFVVFNRTFKESDKVEVKLPNGEVKEVTIGELERLAKM